MDELENIVTLEPAKQTIKEIKTYSFFAYHLTERINIKELALIYQIKPYRLKSDAVIFKFPSREEESYFIIYDFGALVFFNIDENTRKQEIEKIKSQISPQSGVITSEEFSLEVSPRMRTKVSFERVKLSILSFEKIELIALILAQSSTIEYFELSVDEILEKSNAIIDELRKSGKMKTKNKDLIRFIGYCLATKQRIVSNLYVVDKPDIIWTDPALEELFNKMFSMFELKDRFRAIEYKIKLIQEGLEILVDLMKSKREVLLELAIIFLFVIDIFLVLYEVFTK
jgi:uncharacterized Rmd1/YagE family protein